VGFEAHGAAIAVTHHDAKLFGVINDAATHALPGISAVGRALYVFEVHVADAIFRQHGVAFGENFIAEARRVAGIPVEKEILIGNRLEGACGLCCCGGVALVFIFEDEDDVLLRGFVGEFAELFVHAFAVGFVVFETPEVEEADFVGAEVVGHGGGALQHFVLPLEGKAGFVGVSRRAVFGLGSAGPIYFEKRASDVGDFEVVLGEQALHFGDFFVVEIDDVFVPQPANFHQAYAEFVGGHFTSVAKVLRNLVGDDGEPEHAVQFCLRAAQFSGVRSAQCSHGGRAALPHPFPAIHRPVSPGGILLLRASDG